LQELEATTVHELEIINAATSLPCQNP